MTHACTSSRPVLVVIGPSGSGKSTVVRALADRELVRVHPTWTTRPRRADEIDGSLEHRFVSEARFDQLAARGFFLDTVAMFGLPYRYGLPAVRGAEFGPVDTVMLRAPLVSRLTPFVPNHVVYQVEDSPDRARARLVERDCPAADLDARLKDNEAEVVLGHTVADRVFLNNGPLPELVRSIATAMNEDFTTRVGAVA